MIKILLALGYLAAFIFGWFCKALFDFEVPHNTDPWDDLEI